MMKPSHKLFVVVKPWVPYLIATGLAAIAMSYLEQLVPLQVRSVVNTAFDKGSAIKITGTSIAILVTLLAIWQLLQIAQRLASEWAATRVGAKLLEQGVLHLLSYPASWFNDNHSGAIQVRLIASTRAIADMLKLILSDILSPVFGLIIAGIFMFQADIIVGLCAVAVTFALVTLTILQARSQAGIRLSINQAREDQGIRIIEATEGIEQVKLFRAQVSESQRAGQASLCLSNKEYEHHRAMAKYDLAKSVVERAGFIAVLCFSLVTALRHNTGLGFGGVLMIVMLYERVTEPVRHLHRIIDETNEKWILSKDYLDILKIDPIVQNSCMYLPLTRSSNVEFDNVTFSYRKGELAILKNVSFKVGSGAKVAIIGKSGSGKSTIGKLFTGIYVPTSGRVLIGGEQVMPIDMHKNGVRIGMLSQDIYIFHGTVAENILYGRQEATDNDIRCAAHLAGLAEVIAQLPDGYETKLGQRGNTLSGGQKQRLALARLILQNPDIVVLDEPTSGLDPENTRRFFQVIMELFKDRSVFVITHDWQNLQWADEILVVSDGQVHRNYSSLKFGINRNFDSKEVYAETNHANAQTGLL